MSATTPPRPAATTLFRVALAVASVCAFASLLRQWPWLAGPDGILPAVDALARARDAGWTALPSLFWLNPGDPPWRTIGGVGLCAAAAGALPWSPGLCFGVAWVCYLAFVTTGGVFLGFQWDGLLLETLLLAALSFRWWPGRQHAPAHFAFRWAAVLLNLRLVFVSGLVKLLSGDPTWRDLSALDDHFWTQPLPSWTAWWMAQPPSWVRSLLCGTMFVLELVVPWGLVGPARVRRAAVALLVLLQVGFAATGNFGFFNLLAAAVALGALADDDLGATLPAVPDRGPMRRSAVGIASAAVALQAALGLVTSADRLGFAPARLPEPLAAAMDVADAFHAVSPYGLFARMTHDRGEIVIEGSVDGQRWERYDLVYKPDGPDDPMPWTGPHMPRLDWQLWFAALQPDCTHARWYLALARALLHENPTVTQAFAQVPPQPPRFLRSTRWTVGFDPAQPGWVFAAPEPYCPILRLDAAGRLTRAEDPILR